MNHGMNPVLCANSFLNFCLLALLFMQHCFVVLNENVFGNREDRRFQLDHSICIFSNPEFYQQRRQTVPIGTYIYVLPTRYRKQEIRIESFS